MPVVVISLIAGGVCSALGICGTCFTNPRGKTAGCLGKAGFNTALVLTTLPAWMVAKCGPILCGQERARVATLRTVCVMWRIALAISPWVRIRVEGLKEFREMMNANKGKPRLIIANHNSFLDTILTVTLCPIGEISSVKMLVSHHLTRMPVIKDIVLAMDHLVVPFQDQSNGDHNNMAVDKDAAAKVMADMERWMESGNVGAYFPEGRLNPGPSTQLQQFRAGGFAMAVHADTEVFCLAFAGNEVCWPRVGMGGQPSHIQCKVFQLCQSSHSLLRESVSAGSCKQDERAQCLWLANTAHSQVQQALDSIVEEGWATFPNKRSQQEDQKALRTYATSV